VSTNPTTGTPGVTHFDRSQLLRTARLFAGDPALAGLVDLDAPYRTSARLDATEHLELWVVGWPVGSATGWHDHLGSEGAFVTVSGVMGEETWWGTGPEERVLAPGEGGSFGAGQAHALVNLGDSPALTVHAYSPALRTSGRQR
jgi:quercetin dioxygenase-like cupin family protein